MECNNNGAQTRFTYVAYSKHSKEAFTMHKDIKMLAEKLQIYQKSIDAN